VETHRKRILLSPPHLSGLEQRFLLDALDSNWIAPLGPHVDAFEREFAKAVGAPHAAAVSSGTAALHLALRLAGVGPGDDVLVSTLTFVASAAPIVYVHANPVFVDSEPSSWNIDPLLVAEEIEKRAAAGSAPKAIVVVHLFGQCADMDPILSACARHGVVVIEDAAEALGASYRGRPAGTMGLFGVFSFNGNKVITTSGGGALVSSRSDLLARARYLAAQARLDTPHYEHAELGYSYRMSNILAALGCGQLHVLPERVAARRRNARIYQTQLGDLPGLRVQPEAAWGHHARWLTCITIDPTVAGLNVTELRRALELEGIESRPMWKPLHTQPLFAGCETIGGHVAERLFATGLCLPSGSSLTSDDLARVIEVIRKAFAAAQLPRALPEQEVIDVDSMDTAQSQAVPGLETP
jgi:dTDP-4-amino-4,6-dideoxygalactose transaminase